ncbi:tRNA lysidine(34) synthetase TilS, partial [Synechococcus sp. BA-120 BA3]|nr:tRNA lysidine(34) synthetase TilS [Synechococcus sp. BA-120 BA3]
LGVSGGQDSMALTTLLLDLQPLHGWQLQLWHGDHGWRPDAAQQAEELGLWARSQGLDLRLDRADPVPASEAAAREWRYGCLAAAALQGHCTHVVTGHTASDRAETVLLNLARGSRSRGWERAVQPSARAALMRVAKGWVASITQA